MKKNIIVLVVEDNEYFNKLLSRALKEKIKSIKTNNDFRISFYSFSEPVECINKLRSGEFRGSEFVVYIDYYLGNGITGLHIIRMLIEQSSGLTVTLLSNSKSVKEKVNSAWYHYFVLKDNTAPALCCLYLEQYLENKYFITLKER